MEALVLAHWLYTSECCSEKDCKPVPCAEIRAVPDGWQWMNRVFDKTMFRLSPDQGCHVCVGMVPHCVFLPPGA